MNRTWRNMLFSAWDLFWIEVDIVCSTLCSRFSLWLQGCSHEGRLKTNGKCYFKARTSGSIKIGYAVKFTASHRCNRIGLSSPVILETLGNGQICIGNHSGGSSIVISSREKIEIGAEVRMGGNVRIYDHDFHSLDAEIRKRSLDNINSAPVMIGDDVFIGTNAIILKGVEIGDRSIVAAGSVVTKSIGQDEIWGGNPAKRIRSNAKNG